MSQQIVEDYTINTSSKTITLTQYIVNSPELILERLKLITDVTLNQIIYNFADPTVATATISGNIITLSTLPGGMSNTDSLQIIYANQAGDPVYDGDTVLDGADVTQGSINDAANTTGTVGTISGKLRGLLTIFSNVWNPSGWLNVGLATALTQAIDSVLTYPRGFNYLGFTGSSIVLTGPGKLHGVFVNSGTPTLTFYDSTAASGTTLNGAFVTTASTYYNLGDARCINGIYIVISGTANLTVYFDPTTT